MTTNIWFTADTHFYHDKVIAYCNRPFATLEEMHETLIGNWNRVVKRGDLVYHLGDFAFSWNRDPSPVDSLLKQLNGSKHLICGNHDRPAVRLAKGWISVEDYKRIEWRKQKIALLHYAMRVWHGNQRGAWHLYGHSHGSLPDDPNARSLDVGTDVWGFTPVSFDQIAERMALKVFVPVDHHAPPHTLEEVHDALHKDHDCVGGPCECRCGCTEYMGCKLVFGPLCSVCHVRNLRDDEDHGPIEVEPQLS